METLLKIENLQDVEKANPIKFKAIYWLDRNSFIYIYTILFLHIKNKIDNEDGEYNEVQIDCYKQMSNNLLFKLLMFLNFTKNYTTHQQFAVIWKKDNKTITKYRNHVIDLFLDYFDDNPILPENRLVQKPLNITITDTNLNGDIITKSTDIYSVIDTSFFPVSKSITHHIEKDYYSGKHKAHGVKVQTVVNISNGKLCFISRNVYKGSMHDIEIARLSGVCKQHRFELKPNERILGDLGYKGEEYIFYISNIRGGGQNGENLSKIDQRICAFLSSNRIIVENLFGRVKSSLKILTTKYRGDLCEYEDIIFIIFNIFNIVLDFSPLRKDQDTEQNNDNNNQLNIQ